MSRELPNLVLKRQLSVNTNPGNPQPSFEDLEIRGGDVLEDLTDHRRSQLSKLRSHLKIPQRLVDEEDLGPQHLHKKNQDRRETSQDKKIKAPNIPNLRPRWFSPERDKHQTTKPSEPNLMTTTLEDTREQNQTDETSKPRSRNPNEDEDSSSEGIDLLTWNNQPSSPHPRRDQKR